LQFDLDALLEFIYGRDVGSKIPKAPTVLCVDCFKPKLVGEKCSCDIEKVKKVTEEDGLRIIKAIAQAIAHAKEVSARQRCEVSQRVGHFVTAMRRELGSWPSYGQSKYDLRNFLCNTLTWYDIGLLRSNGSGYNQYSNQVQEWTAMANLEAARYEDEERGIRMSLVELDGQLGSLSVQQKHADLLYKEAEDLTEKLAKVFDLL